MQYIDHNLVAERSLNADEHLFLRSACRRFGIWYSRPGNGISHPVHMERFGKPGADPGRLRQPHAGGRVTRHAGDRRGRHGGGAGAGR